MFATFAEAAQEQSLSGKSPADPLITSIEEARAKQDLYFQTLNQNLPEVSSEMDLEISGPVGNIPIRLVYPSTSGPLPCIIFIRGAGFWAGSLDSHSRTMRSLSLLSNCIVCAIDYRRTPEFHYPTQRDEVLALISWLKQNASQFGISQKFALFGESAGATIALTCALSLRDRGEQDISGLTLFYNNAGGPNPTARAYSQWVWKQYLGHDGLSTNSNAVPLLDDLHGLPPVWLGVGEEDPLMKDTLEVNRKVIAAGGKSTLVIYPKLPHAFVMFSGTLKPSYEALEAAALASKNFLNHS